MTRNPLLNALAASGYVVLVASLIMSVPPRVPFLSVAWPVVFLSTFVVSAALVGYLFLLQPLLLALSGKTQEGIALFLQTLGLFALISLVVVAAYAALL